MTSQTAFDRIMAQEAEYALADDFPKEVRRVANLLAYSQDVSSEDPLLVAAAGMYLEWQS